MRTDRTIPAILVVLAVVGLGGCSAPSGSPRPSNVAVAPALRIPAERDAWLLIGRGGDPGYRVIRAASGESFLELPPGAPARADWGRELVATSNGSRTLIRDLVVQPDPSGPELAIDGAWRLPTIGQDPTPVGISADGSVAVLVEASPAARAAGAVSRFAVMSLVPLAGPSRVVELAGSFEYDAISSDGRILYVVEHLLGGAEGRYQVRAVDLPAGTMRDTIIADKRNLEEAMAGWPIAQVRRPDGLVLTLYRGPQHPFVHALNTKEAWAVCIDLPAVGTADAAAARDWGIASKPDSDRVFAANATLGLAAEIETTELTVRQSLTVAPPTAAAPIVLAKFGHAEGGPVGRRVVIAPDGGTVYAAGSSGIVVMGTSRLSESRRILDGVAIGGLGLSADGATLFALETSGRITAVDAATGDVIGQVPGDTYDRLLAVVPG
jgi:hypothetical protein